MIESNLMVRLIELLLSSYVFISNIASKIELNVFTKFFEDDDDDVSVVMVKMAIASASCKISDNSVINFIIAVSPNNINRCVNESTTIRILPLFSVVSLVIFKASIV